MRAVVLLVVLVSTPLTDAITQEQPWASGTQVGLALSDLQPTGVMLQAASRRSPVLAGTLSLLVPLGTGSFYAGNTTHGVIHAAAGVATASIFVVNHFCLDQCTEAQETWKWVGLVGFGANWIAGTVVAVLNANAYNRRHRAPALPVSVMPQRDGVGIAASITF